MATAGNFLMPSTSSKNVKANRHTQKNKGVHLCVGTSTQGDDRWSYYSLSQVIHELCQKFNYRKGTWNTISSLEAFG